MRRPAASPSPPPPRCRRPTPLPAFRCRRAPQDGAPSGAAAAAAAGSSHTVCCGKREVSWPAAASGLNPRDPRSVRDAAALPAAKHLARLARLAGAAWGRKARRRQSSLLPRGRRSPAGRRCTPTLSTARTRRPGATRTSRPSGRTPTSQSTLARVRGPQSHRSVACLWLAAVVPGLGRNQRCGLACLHGPAAARRAPPSSRTCCALQAL